jgi:hypothetical protein
LKALFAAKQDTLVSGTNIKTINGNSILGNGNIQAGDPDAVKYVSQTLTEAQKAQARTNISAYQKPSSGIPASDFAAGVIPDISGKQDTIQDLSTIRSGASLGSTSVQPVDIENMVEAEPIGSIIPPVNPSEFSTKEEVSQLRQEVNNLSGKYYGLFESVNDLPEGDAVGYAFVGTQAPFAIYNFNGTAWVDSGASAQAIYGEPGTDGVGLQTVTSMMDGTVVLSLTNGDTVTIDLNHNHPQYLRYAMLESESDMPANPDSILYMWPQTS